MKTNGYEIFFFGGIFSAHGEREKNHTQTKLILKGSNCFPGNWLPTKTVKFWLLIILLSNDLVVSSS